MNKTRRDGLKTISALGAAGLLPRSATGQTGSAVPAVVNVVVPFGAGGSTDVIARLLAGDVGKRLQRNFVVENKPGAGGNIGTRHVAVAKPDAATLLYSTATPFCINPFVYKSLPFDPDNDFAAVSRTAKLPLVLVVNAGLGIRDAAGFVAWLRKNPDQASFSSYGIGTSSHIAGTLFTRQLGVPQVLHVPYKDMTAMSDLAAGRNTFHIDAWSAVEPLVRAGKLVALAVSSTETLPWAPSLPTIAAVTGTDYEVVTWHAVFAPRKTPADLVRLLNSEFQKSIDKPEIQKEFVERGFLLYPAAEPAAIDAFVKADKVRWKGYVESAGIVPS